MTETPAAHPPYPLDVATLMLRRVTGEAAAPALSLLASSDGGRDGWVDTEGARAVYALVDVGSPAADPVAAAVVTAGSDVAHLTLSVSPPYRRRGLGARVLAEVLDVLRSQGLAHVDVEVGESLAAARLCERAGFRPMDGARGRLALDL